MSWYSGLEEICRLDEPLAAHTWYGLGGPARWFFTPHTREAVAGVLRRCAQEGVPWRVLGRGANLLVRDAGFAGAVIKLSADHMDLNDPDRITADAGADFTHLVRRAVERGYGGLENLAGIPGSVGGIVRMNAGGKYGYIARYVTAVELLHPDGRVETRAVAEMGFGYRTSGVRDAIITGVSLRLEHGNTAALLARFREIWNEKAASQPPVAAKSAGCIFKNPPALVRVGEDEPQPRAAGWLIDRAGLKGVRRGGAEISTRHANFILAYPGARAQDVLDLIRLAQERVRDQFGVELELEVEIW